VHLKRKPVILAVSQLLKEKCEQYHTSASKRDWVRVFSILNVIITMLPSNDVVHFSRIILKLLMQNSPAEVKIVALKVFEDMYRGDGNPIPSRQSFQIIQNLFKCKIIPSNPLQSTLAVSYCKLLKSSLLNLHNIDADQCSQQLFPEFFLKMLGYLNTPHNNIRYDTVANVACKSIEDIVEKCIPQQTIVEAVQLKKSGSADTPQILLNLLSALSATLTVEFRPQFPRILQLIQKFFAKLGRTSAILMQDVLVKVDQLYALNDQELTFSVEKTLSTAAKYMGVDAFMQILPLGKKANPRLWMFRLFHSHIANNSLKTYETTFYPKIEKLQSKVDRAVNTDNHKEATLMTQLINEIWTLMPDFFVFPMDLNEQTFGSFLQLWMHIFGTLPKRQNIVCRCIMRLIQTNQEYLQTEGGARIPDNTGNNSATTNFKRAIANYSPEMAHNALSLVSTHAETLLPALFTIYSSADKNTSLRTVVSDTITLIASVAPTNLVCTFFKRILIKILKGDDTQAMSEEDAKNHKLIMLDLAGALAPYIDASTATSFFSILKSMLVAFDRPIQKKSNKALMHMCSKNKNFIAAHGSETLDYLCTILSSCDPAAKKYRLATLKALVQGVPSESVVKNISHLLGEGLISSKEISSQARDNSVAFLEMLFRRVTFGDATIAVEDIPVTEELTVAACNFMKALVSGLGGMGHEMISATIDMISHLLRKYLEFFEPIAESIFNTVVLLLDFPNVGVVLSCIKFVKVCLSEFSSEFFEPHLATLIPSICKAIERHSNTLSKARFLFEKMLTVFDVELIENFTPENHKRLIRNVARESRRTARKKEQEKVERAKTTKSHSINVDGNLDLTAAAIKEEDSAMQDEDMEAIKSGKDEEVSISTNGKVVIGGKRKRDEVKLDDYNDDNGDDSDNEIADTKKPAAESIASTDFESRKRIRLSRDTPGSDELNLNDPHAKHYLEIKAKQKQRKDVFANVSMGKEFKSKRKNARGDMKRGKTDPYAYLPLDPMQMNRRRRNKKTVFDKFEKETRR